VDSTPQAAFHPLGRTQAEAVLRRNHVGRLAYARHEQVDVEPVNYVFAGEWLWCRTTEGTKWHALADSAYRWWPVAFEVDEVDGIFQWRSVVVKGGFQALTPPDQGGDADVWANALTQLRTLLPEALTPDDPAPGRDRVFRIAVQEITGREAVPPAGPSAESNPVSEGSVPVARRST
jgi:uncharacterized protein